MTTDRTATIASDEQPTIDERRAALLVHGRGLPRAVELGGPAAVEAWCEQQELVVAAEIAEADAADAIEAEGRDGPRDTTGHDQDEDAEVTRTTGPPTDDAPGPFGTPEVIAGIHTRLDEIETWAGGAAGVVDDGSVLDSLLTRLTALETAVEAIAASGPTEAQVGAVAAGGRTQKDHPPPAKVTPGRPRKKDRKKAGKK